MKGALLIIPMLEEKPLIWLHRGLELLGINGYTTIREYENNVMKKGFCYEVAKDRFVCM